MKTEKRTLIVDGNRGKFIGSNLVIFFLKNLTNLRCALCLTDFYFHRTVCKQKIFGEI